jgi:hypothetical protein
MGLFLFLLLHAGCMMSAAEGQLTFKGLEYPVSMSPYLHGEGDTLLRKAHGLRVIGPFAEERVCWNIFYSLVPLGQCKDTEAVALRMNEAIRAVGGDGMVNAAVQVTAGFMIYMHPLTLLPFWPADTHILVTGDIVKIDQTAKQEQRRKVPVASDKEVRIRERRENETQGFRLAEECLVLGRVEAIFAGHVTGAINRGTDWYDMVPAEKGDDIMEFDMKAYLRERGRLKGANVVQVVSVIGDRQSALQIHDMSPQAPSIEHFRWPAVLKVLYWNCPDLPSSQ